MSRATTKTAVPAVIRRLLREIIIMGDSLSDRGRMAERKLFDIIPMSLVSGLDGKSPEHRFTNGLVWTDYLAFRIAEARGFKSISLKETTRVTAETGEVILRTYCEGGATAHSYYCEVSSSPMTTIEGFILNNLNSLRNRMLNDDAAIPVDAKYHCEALVIEWSGANDLLTINPSAEIDPIEKAIAARIENMQMLINKGYQNFLLINLPDLSLVPRFQAKTESEQNHVRDAVMLFNKRLAEEVEKFQQKNTNCTIVLHDANPLFTEAMNNPEKFGLETTKKKTPYTQSHDFNLAKPASANGYAFWDDVHPTTVVHKLLMENILGTLQENFMLSATQDTLMEIFREHYGTRLEADKGGFFGCFASAKFIEYKNPDLTLERILEHALYEGGGRTRDVIIDLGWIDASGKCVTQNINIVRALHNLEQKRTHRAANTVQPHSLCC